MSAEAFLPTRPPRRTLETAEFWDGCASERLLLPRCDDCGEFIWYPRLVCPFCGSQSVSYVEASGLGTVYSFTVVRRGSGAYRDSAPYVVAMVELDEGPIMMTNVAGADPETIVVGMPVRVVFEPAGDDGADAIPRFIPRDRAAIHSREDVAPLGRNIVTPTRAIRPENRIGRTVPVDGENPVVTPEGRR